MAEYLIQGSTLTAIGDAIREKTGKTDIILPGNMPTEISQIETGIDTSDATAVASDILSGKIAYNIDGKITGSMDNLTTSTTIHHATDNASPVIAADAIYRSTCTDNVDRIQLRYNGDGGYIGKNTLIGYETSKFGSATPSQVLSGATFTSTSGINAAGTIPTKTSSDLSASGATVTVPAGYYASQATKSVSTATQVTPSISVNSSGLITASATQTAGFVSAGTKSATQQLTVQAAKTVTPSTSAQTAVASGRYTTGTVTVAGSANLVAGNIKKGVNIFGVTGTFDAVELNFSVVGGTSAPSNPAANTIWINTSTSIAYWEFISVKPTWAMAEGYVYIVSDISTNNTFSDFNALKSKGGLWVHPINVYQYVGGTWVLKNAMIYKNNAWVDITRYLCKDYTPNPELVAAGYTQLALNDSGTYLSLTSSELVMRLNAWGTSTYKLNLIINANLFNTVKCAGITQQTNSGYATEQTASLEIRLINAGTGTVISRASCAPTARGTTENFELLLDASTTNSDCYIDISFTKSGNYAAFTTFKEIVLL